MNDSSNIQEMSPEFLATLEPKNQEIIAKLLAATEDGTLEEDLSKMAKATNESDEKREQDSQLVCCRCHIGHETFRLQTGRELLLCSGCKKAKYCSKECRRAGWKSGHKKMCKVLKAIAATATGEGHAF